MREGVMGKKCHLLPLDRGGARTEGRRQFWSAGKERERRPERGGNGEEIEGIPFRFSH